MLRVALLAGLCLFASDHPLRWWPLQFVAFVPLWWAVGAAHRRRDPLWPLGFVFGCGYLLPLVVVMGAAPPILVAAIASVVQWSLLAPAAGRLLALGPVRGAFAVAAAVSLAEVAVRLAVPMFGTAQCFVRPLSAAPALVAFVAFTGMTSVVFVVTALQALVAAALRGPRRAVPLAVAAVLVLCLGALDVVRWTRPLGAPVRVAAFGWHPDATDGNTPLLDVFDAAFARAEQANVILVVTPETGIVVGAADRGAAIAALGHLASQHFLTAAIGVWHGPTRDNRIWFVDASGRLRAEYRKTHLIPWLENYAAGDGTLATIEVADTMRLDRFNGLLVPCGGMICQDDNFPDFARGYGRLGTPLLAVPTNDWPAIRAFHLESGVFRAIENGYAVVRAASGGISALISPRGEVLAQIDHVAKGPDLLCGEVPAGDGVVTVYARCGDWPLVGLCVAVLALAAIALRRNANLAPRQRSRVGRDAH